MIPAKFSSFAGIHAVHCPGGVIGDDELSGKLKEARKAFERSLRSG